MSSDQERRDPVVRLFGALLMAVGVLIMTLCGLCSLAVLFSLAGGGGGEFGGMLSLVLVFGGVPIGVGFVLFWVGRTLRRPRDR
jgi:hypothetical protein